METKEYRLSDICDFQGGTQPPKEEWINEPRDGYVRMLQIRDFTQDNPEHIGYVKDTKKLNKCDKDDILIGRYGASVGKILTGLSGAYNVAIIKTVPNEEVISKKYLYFLLKGAGFQNFIVTIGSRAAQAGFNKDDLTIFKIPVPKSLDDQEKLVNIFERTENLINLRKKSISLCNSYLRYSFIKLVNEHNGELKSLEELVEIQSGLINPNEPPYADMYHVGIVNVESNTGKLINLKKAKDESLISGKYFFDSDHILYSKIRPYLNKVALPDFEGICSADMYPIKPKHEKINKYFLKNILTSDSFLAFAEKNSDRTNIPKINRKALLSYQLYLPQKSVQDKFAKVVEQIEKLKSYYFKSLDEFQLLFDSLSYKALKGALDVIEPAIENTKEIPIDAIDVPVEIKSIKEHPSFPDEIVNKIGQLEGDLKIQGGVPFSEDYVKYRIISKISKNPFSFDQLWHEITKFPFENLPDYDKVAEMLFKWLEGGSKAFVKQHFNEATKQIELIVNETAKA